MKAIAGISSKHMALLEEYRMALSLWSETRGLYSPETMEVALATKHLEDIEHELSLCRPDGEKNPSESGKTIGLLPPAL